MSGIVILNVTQSVAPAPSTLQSTGAFVSQGGTTLATGAYSLLTQMSDLTAIIAAPKTLSTLTWASGVVTATAAAAHGVTSGDTFLTTIAGVTPAAYNGTFLATATGAETFTYAIAANPGTETVPGTYTPRNSAELTAMATTFFGQGASQAVYVLELGAGEATAGVSELTTFITANPSTFYSYLVPRSWDANSAFLAFLPSYEALTAKTYFYVTTTTGTYTNYPATMKCVKAMVEAPSIPVTEFSHAADFQHDLAYAPSPATPVTPSSFAFLYGVTPYPLVGNGSLLATLKAAGVNYVATGAEGGISTAMIVPGTTMDINPFTYWYSVDWEQLNTDLNISNAVINGSNGNPLYFNQAGINYLQDIAAATIGDAITFGMAAGSVITTALTGPAFLAALDAGTFAGQCVVNAVPFLTYTQQNPSDYGNGKYSGFSVVYIPSAGFRQIVFNINVSQFIGTQ